MGLFRPYQSNQAADAPADKAITDDDPNRGKGAPTLSRREAEALRREQMRPTLSKSERKARERQLRRVREEKAFADLELQPERVLLRNFIDTRWTFSEFSWPLLILAIALFIAGAWFPMVAFWGSYAMWGIMAAIIIEVTLQWTRFKKVLDQRMPGAPRRGLMMYLASRMVSMRRYRRPPTAIDRGAAY